MSKQPNVVILLADQLRAQALGYAGDPNAKTPFLDALEHNSINFTNAISCCPVCSPARASLLTGQYPLSHGVIVNDVGLRASSSSFASVLKAAGYDTAYIGKWHLDGSGSRSAFIPHDRRQNFDFWSVLECTHDYFHSKYWNNTDSFQEWKGYDAIAQTNAALDYIKAHKSSQRPFFLIVSWGPPHDPYKMVPRQYKYISRRRIKLRPNVPADSMERARKDLSGYYAHINALDECCAMMVTILQELQLDNDTILVFTSDHGDMLGSQGISGKQCPWDESIRIPLLIRNPALENNNGYKVESMINIPDIMPTILSQCGIPIPDTVEGMDFTGIIQGHQENAVDESIFACFSPFSNWYKNGREYRGIRTKKYTYVRDLQGPWLLYDNDADPFQLKNLVGKSEIQEIEKELDTRLYAGLKVRGDAFLPRNHYLQRFNYTVGPDGAVPYQN